MTQLLRVVSQIAVKYYLRSQDPTEQCTGWQTFTLLLNIAKYICEHRLHARGPHFTKLHAESINAVRASCSCLKLLPSIDASFAETTSQVTNELLHLVLLVTDTTVLPAPTVVMQSVVDLMASLPWTVPTEILHSSSNMQLLKKGIHSISQSLPYGIQGKLYTALSLSLLPPTLPINSPEWSSRQSAYMEFASPVSHSLIEVTTTLTNNPSRKLEVGIRSHISRDTFILKSLARAVRDAPKPAKECYAQIISSLVQSSLALFPLYLDHSVQQEFSHCIIVVQHVVAMYTVILDACRKELGSECIVTVVGSLVNHLQHGPLIDEMNRSGKSAAQLVATFLKLLETIVKEPTSSLNVMMPR